MQNRRRLVLSLAVLFAVNIAVITLFQSAEAAVYRQGSTGDAVRTIQTKLSNWGYFSGAIDGIYGPATKNAVVALQRLTGLPQDGIVGEDTWAALYRLYAGIVDTVETYTNVIPEQFRPDLPESQATGLTQYPGQPMTLGSADERGVTQ